MADITQITAVYRLDFSANTPEAEAWMKKHYGSREIFFDLPNDDAYALAFVAEAKARGFTIDVE
jgi:hypothetical protein